MKSCLSGKEKEFLSNDRGLEATEWAKKVKERDQYKCTVCGSIEKGLVSHHDASWDSFKNPIDRYGGEKVLELHNGRALCQNCHISFHQTYGFGKNTYYQFEQWVMMRKYFYQLLSEKK